MLALNPDNNWSESSTLVLATLHLHSSRTMFLSTRNKHWYKHTRNKQTSTTKKRALHKRKALKEQAKGYRARSYDRKNARNAENRATVEKKEDRANGLFAWT